MTDKRLKDISENVSRRILINAVCGATPPAEEEVLELLEYIKELRDEIKKLKKG